MVLHWLPGPLELLRRWKGWLKLGGRLYVALPVEGSFQEWRDLCLRAGVKDGLWSFPEANFADEIVQEAEQKNLLISYSSALEFLQRLKSIGAATSAPNHRPSGLGAMRALLRNAPRPFAVTYQILYLEIRASDSI